MSILLLLSSSLAVVDKGEDSSKTANFKVSVGAILDLGSHAGKEDKVAIEMAFDDFYKSCSSHKPSLYIKDSGGDSSRASMVADELVWGKQVQAIIGLRTWEEAASIAKIGTEAQVPILSLANTAPSWASQRWPFLKLAVHSYHKQMKAVAGIVKSWRWRQVSVIYEDTNSFASGIIPYLTEALQEIKSEIDYMLPLSPLSSNHHLLEELVKLKKKQCRVFIVHTSLHLATNLFVKAKHLRMLEKEYVWITTNGISDFLDSVNDSGVSSMQGVLGVRNYYPKNTSEFRDFSSRFRSRFHAEHPFESISEFGISRLEAYDAAWAMALAMEEKMVSSRTCNCTDRMSTAGGVPPSGWNLLNRITSSNFKGLTGEFLFTQLGNLPQFQTFEIINVVGKSYRELGYWREGFDFFESFNGERIVNNSTSMGVLGQVFWPGGPWFIPRGWALPTTENPLRIGVPARTTFEQFVKVRKDGPGNDTSVNGFSIDVFKAALEFLPYHLSYKFIPFEGTYDSLVLRVSSKVIDAVVADTAIVANRCQYVDFSQPYSDSGVVTLYNGLVVMLIEKKLKFKGFAWNQLGILIWLSFTTLFSLHGGKLGSNLSRMTMVVWLFVALVISQSYTASLTSMLTIHRLDTPMVTIESLRRSNAMVGCDANSFVVKYLERALGFNPKNIKKMNSGDEYPLALKNGEIEAALLEVPYLKLLLSKYCDSSLVAGQAVKVGGFGFVFPKGSPMLHDISEAVLKVSESGKLRDLETALVSSFNCSTSESDSSDYDSLKPNSFWGLFGITFGTSTIALIAFFLRIIRRRYLRTRMGSIHADNQMERDEQCLFEIEMKEMRINSFYFR
ncbi:hypothetical protein Sjap_025862 [Stephania japonica]|uniref:Glutamate receptor n=1 Tax=Stephania japonica TaxID=461633 RepID=A0AAP0E2J4_9MAGN